MKRESKLYHAGKRQPIRTRKAQPVRLDQAVMECFEDISRNFAEGPPLDTGDWSI